MSYLGAIEDVGLSPYKISGDPVTALVAQLNRFAGKTINPGGLCKAMRPVGQPFPLIAAIDTRAADAAATIVWLRYSCSPIDVSSKDKEAWALRGQTYAWVFVMNNINEITTTIAQFGDKLGLEPAKVGITERDPKMTPKFPFVTVALLGALAVGAVAVSWRKR
jgi:hypothetical protein